MRFAKSYTTADAIAVPSYVAVPLPAQIKIGKQTKGVNKLDTTLDIFTRPHNLLHLCSQNLTFTQLMFLKTRNTAQHILSELLWFPAKNFLDLYHI